MKSSVEVSFVSYYLSASGLAGRTEGFHVHSCPCCCKSLVSVTGCGQTESKVDRRKKVIYGRSWRKRACWFFLFRSQVLLRCRAQSLRKHPGVVLGSVESDKTLEGSSTKCLL